MSSPVTNIYRRVSAVLPKVCLGTTSAAQVFSLGRLEECLVNEAPEDEYRRRVTAFHQPLLCSSLESGARPSSYDTGANDPAIKHHQTGPS